MIRIEVDDSKIDAEVATFAATVRQADAARLRALRKTAQWLGREIIKEVAKKERMPLLALHGRVFVSRIASGATEAEVFVGTMPVDAARLGRPVQAGSGAKVGRHAYPGAFVGRIYSGKEKVWIRLGSKHYDPARYPTTKRSGDRFGGDRRLLGRFPVVRAAVPIDGVVDDVVERIGGDVQHRFLTTFRHELNYEVNVK